MPKFFSKNQVFAFLASFLITFVAGFFLWGIFANFGSNVLNQVSAKFFTASLVPAENPPQNEAPEVAPVEVKQSQPVVTQAPQESKQDQLDDFQEKLDVVKAKVQALVDEQNKIEQNQKDKLADANKNKIPDEKNDQPKNTPPQSGGGGTHINYPKILISEIQIASPADEKQEFVELYNPNSTDVALGDWYLQRKTAGSLSWATYAPNNLFAGKTISKNGYFLIARTGFYSGLADIFTDNPITNYNSFALKNPNGDIADTINLLATASPSTSQTIGRKVLPDLTEQDTGDNPADFELQIPTPRAQNLTFVAPPTQEPTDTTPPEIVFDVASVQTSLNFPINFTITDPLVGAVSPSGAASLVFRWQKAGDTAWQEDLPILNTTSSSTFSAVRNFTGQDATSYNFQAQATDFAGNTSAWLPETPISVAVSISASPVAQKNILINQIQTDGQTSKDEFVQLFNPNNFDVDLAGFALKKKTSTGAESNLVSSGKFAGIILSLNYFLIAPPPNDDGTPNYTGFTIPDLFYSGKTYSVAANNTVLLYDKNNNLQDKVGFGSAIDFETAPAQNPPAFKILTRANGIDTDNNSLDFSLIDTTTSSRFNDLSVQ